MVKKTIRSVLEVSLSIDTNAQKKRLAGNVVGILISFRVLLVENEHNPRKSIYGTVPSA